MVDFHLRRVSFISIYGNYFQNEKRINFIVSFDRDVNVNQQFTRTLELDVQWEYLNSVTSLTSIAVTFEAIIIRSICYRLLASKLSEGKQSDLLIGMV